MKGAECRVEGVKSLGLIEVLVDGDLPCNQLRIPHWMWDLRIQNFNSIDVYLYAQGKDLIKIKNKDDVMKAAGSNADEVESFIKVKNKY